MMNPDSLDAVRALPRVARETCPSLADLEDRFDLHGPLADDPVIRWLCDCRVQLLGSVNGRAAGTVGHIVPVEHPAWQRCNRRRLLPVQAGSEVVMIPFADLALAGAEPRGPDESLESWLERCLRAGDLEVILAQPSVGLSPSDQAHLALYRAAALRHAGRPAETLALLTDARDLLHTLEQQVDAARLRCRALTDERRNADALRVGRKAEPLLASVPRRASGRFLAALAFAHHAAGCDDDAARLLTEAEHCVAEQDDALTSGEIALLRGCHLRGRSPEAAFEAQTAALRHFQLAGTIPECGNALGNLMLLAMDRLDREPRTRAGACELLRYASAAVVCFRVTQNRPAQVKVFSLLVESERDPVRALDHLDELAALDPGATASDALHHFVRGQWEMAAQRWDEAETSLARAAHLVPEDADPEGAAKIAARRAVLATGRDDVSTARVLLARAESLAGHASDEATQMALEQAQSAVKLLDAVPGPALRDLQLLRGTVGAQLCMWGSDAVASLLEEERHSILFWAEQRLQEATPPRDLEIESLVRDVFFFGQGLCHYYLRRGRPSPSVAVPLEPEILRGWLAAIKRPGTREHAMVEAAVTAALSAAEWTMALAIHFLVSRCLASGRDRDHLRELLTDILRVTTIRGLTLETMVDAAAREVEEQLSARAVAHELGDPPTDSDEVANRPRKPKRNWRDQLRSLTRLLEPTARPWPLDLRCRCGADLRPYIFCCDHTRPLDLTLHAKRLRAGYQITCRCCGGELSGFRCDACGQVLTWDLGVVPTLKGEN
ncbi:MAG: hypothetical protein IT371_23680 [Deltaproteobacteria bacterium]|nr:hypothetical protein [Deltaproteobacteria bacterium]